MKPYSVEESTKNWRTPEGAGLKRTRLFGAMQFHAAERVSDQSAAGCAWCPVKPLARRLMTIRFWPSRGDRANSTRFRNARQRFALCCGADRRDGRDGGQQGRFLEQRRRVSTSSLHLARSAWPRPSDHDRTRDHARTECRRDRSAAYHPHDDGRDTGEIRNRHGDDSAYCSIGRMAFYDGIGLRSSPRRIDPRTRRGHPHKRTRRGW